MPDHDRLEASAVAWARSSLASWLRGTLPHRMADRTRVVLTYLATRADWKSGRCDTPIGAAKIGEVCDMCPRSVHDALEALAAAGWIAALDVSRRGTSYAVRHPDAPPLCQDAAPPRRRPAPAPKATPAEPTRPEASPAPAIAKPKGGTAADMAALLGYYAKRYQERRREQAPVGPVERAAAAKLLRGYGLDVACRAIDGAMHDPWAVSRCSLAFVAEDPGRWAGGKASGGRILQPRAPRPGTAEAETSRIQEARLAGAKLYPHVPQPRIDTPPESGERLRAMG